MSEPADRICHHDFTSRKVESDELDVDRSSSNAKDDHPPDDNVVPFDAGGTLNNERYDFIATIRKYEEIITFLRSLHSSASSTTKSIRRETISGMSAIELSRAINESTPNDWKMRPAYFTALVHKFNNDVLAKYIDGESHLHNDIPSE